MEELGGVKEQHLKKVSSKEKSRKNLSLFCKFGHPKAISKGIRMLMTWHFSNFENGDAAFENNLNLSPKLSLSPLHYSDICLNKHVQHSECLWGEESVR